VPPLRGETASPVQQEVCRKGVRVRRKTHLKDNMLIREKSNDGVNRVVPALIETAPEKQQWGLFDMMTTKRTSQLMIDKSSSCRAYPPASLARQRGARCVFQSSCERLQRLKTIHMLSAGDVTTSFIHNCSSVTFFVLGNKSIRVNGTRDASDKMNLGSQVLSDCP